MFLRFFIFILSFICSFNTYAITSDDIGLTIQPSNNSILKNKEIANSFIIKLDLPEGWYTYYKNGGDSGLGAKLDIKNLTKDFITPNLFYSTPKKHTEQGFVSYIYKDNAEFSFNLQRNNLKEPSLKQLNADKLALDGNLELLMCKNICIPIKKDFNITLPVTDKVQPNIEFYKLANNFSPTENVEFSIKNNFLYIKLPTIEKLKSALFIPDSDEFINDNYKQTIINIQNTNFLKIELDEYLETIPLKFTGIIKTNLGNYNIKAKQITIAPLSKSAKIFNLAVVAIFALIGGVILNLMPCVLPVIGLKIFALLKHKSIKERLKGALSYSAGVFISMMIIVGLLVFLKSLGNELAWGFQLQNKYFVGFMIALLMAIGLNLLGMFEFGNALSSKANKLNMKYSGDFFTGILTTLVATPCTAPFMATSLGFALSSNSNSITFTIFSFLALGICLPVLIIAIIPKAHKVLPKPGNWSERLKQFLAFPIFATVVWLVWVLDSGSYIITLCLSGVFLASFIGWNLTLTSKFKYLIIIISLALSSLAIYKHINIAEPALEFNKQTIIELNNEGKNVFVDFTAKWCLTCQYNKKTVLDLTSTRKLFNDNNTAFMVADWTLRDDKITKELERLGRSGVPAYAIYPADSSKPILLPELLTQNTIKEYIRKL